MLKNLVVYVSDLEIKLHVPSSAARLVLRCQLPWVDHLRYLGIFITCFRVLKISLDHAKRRFYRSTNAIFGKVGRVANEGVVLQLLSSKCLPSLMYGVEACLLVKSDLLSLNCVVYRYFMKLFKTNNIDLVKTCQQYTSISRCQALCGINAAHHSILSSPVPKIFSVKLHRILFQFVLVE